MKLRNILGAAVVTTAAALFMSVSAFAATSFTVAAPQAKAGGEVVTSVAKNGYVFVPVQFESSDNTNLASFDIELNFDSSKYKLLAIKNNAKATDVFGDETDAYSISFNDAGRIIAFSPYSSFDVSSTDPIFWAGFQAQEAISDISVTDFSIKAINQINIMEDGASDSTTVSQSSMATYVTCNLKIDDSWDKGYVHKLRVVLKDSATQAEIKSDYIYNCVENAEGDYTFVVKLVPDVTKKKSVVDVDFVAEVADKEDALDYTDVTLGSEKNVVVEYIG